MAELIARGSKTEDCWRRPLKEGESLVLGRRSGTWEVPWEQFISGEHARLTWHAGQLQVEALAGARNPIFLNGQQTTSFSLRPGEYFVIGGTIFGVVPEAEKTIAFLPEPLQVFTFRSDQLKEVQFRDASHRIDVLSRLPEVIAQAANDMELFVRLANMLLAGIPRAEVVALVEVEERDEGVPTVAVRHWDRRRSTEFAFSPSQRLILEAVGHQRSVLHLWMAGNEPGTEMFTQQGNLDWAFCTPVQGEACKGWAIYVAGHQDREGDVLATVTDNSNAQEDLKFTELVAAILSALRQVQRLQQRQASLGHFFSPAVLRTLANNDPEVVLQPRLTEVTVLFCDLRGFSRESEKHAGDLMSLLERVSKALGVMTQNILDQGGVIGDFQGDAAMGFWGWPLAQPDTVKRACLAALAIRTFFEASANRPGHPLQGFLVGIGIATGQGVAGKIGALAQAKIGVFGPVVNLASRLEGMTKILGAAITLDETTASRVKEQLPSTVARSRCLAVVQPLGLNTPLTVSELLAPLAENPLLTDENLADYEAALKAFGEGQWSRALTLLHRVPPEDCAKDFLTQFILQHKRTPPVDWKGIIPLLSKN